MVSVMRMGDWEGAAAATVLAVSSSLDNLMVGLALGLSKRSLPRGTNFLISTANAFGMLVAALAGGALGSSAPLLASVTSALLFAYLGIAELYAYLRSPGAGGQSPLADAAHQHPWKVAVPMSLNNLAGGLAGGLAGVSAAALGLSAFAASWLLMFGGHLAGARAGGGGWGPDHRLVGGALFVWLSVSQVWHLVPLSALEGGAGADAAQPRP